MATAAPKSNTPKLTIPRATPAVLGEGFACNEADSKPDSIRQLTYVGAQDLYFRPLADPQSHKPGALLRYDDFYGFFDDACRIAGGASVGSAKFGKQIRARDYALNIVLTIFSFFYKSGIGSVQLDRICRNVYNLLSGDYEFDPAVEDAPVEMVREEILRRLENAGYRYPDFSISKDAGDYSNNLFQYTPLTSTSDNFHKNWAARLRLDDPEKLALATTRACAPTYAYTSQQPLEWFAQNPNGDKNHKLVVKLPARLLKPFAKSTTGSEATATPKIQSYTFTASASGNNTGSATVSGGGAAAKRSTVFFPISGSGSNSSRRPSADAGGSRSSGSSASSRSDSSSTRSNSAARESGKQSPASRHSKSGTATPKSDGPKPTVQPKNTGTAKNVTPQPTRTPQVAANRKLDDIGEERQARYTFGKPLSKTVVKKHVALSRPAAGILAPASLVSSSTFVLDRNASLVPPASIKAPIISHFRASAAFATADNRVLKYSLEVVERCNWVHADFHRIREVHDAYTSELPDLVSVYKRCSEVAVAAAEDYITDRNEADFTLPPSSDRVLDIGHLLENAEGTTGAEEEEATGTTNFGATQFVMQERDRDAVRSTINIKLLNKTEKLLEKTAEGLKDLQQRVAENVVDDQQDPEYSDTPDDEKVSPIDVLEDATSTGQNDPALVSGADDFLY